MQLKKYNSIKNSNRIFCKWWRTVHKYLLYYYSSSSLFLLLLYQHPGTIQCVLDYIIRDYTLEAVVKVHLILEDLWSGTWPSLDPGLNFQQGRAGSPWRSCRIPVLKVGCWRFCYPKSGEGLNFWSQGPAWGKVKGAHKDKYFNHCFQQKHIVYD